MKPITKDKINFDVVYDLMIVDHVNFENSKVEVNERQCNEWLKVSSWGTASLISQDDLLNSPDNNFIKNGKMHFSAAIREDLAVESDQKIELSTFNKIFPKITAAKIDTVTLKCSDGFELSA